MRRLLNPLTHTAARPALRTPLFQAQQVRGFAAKRGPKKGSKKAAAAAAKPAAAAATKPAAAAAATAAATAAPQQSSGPDAASIASIAAATGGIPTLPDSHASSMTGYVGVAARALFNSAAAKGAESLATVEHEIDRLFQFLNKPASNEVAEFSKVMSENSNVNLANFIVEKELTFMRRQSLEEHVRRLVRDANQKEVSSEPVDQRFQFSPVLETALVEIMNAKRFKKIDQIFAEFQDVMDAFKGITRAIVTVAQPLTPEQETLVKKFMAIECGNKAQVVLTVEVDPSLIAGMQIQVGEKFWNMAASHHLNKSKKSLHATMSGKKWEYEGGKMFA